MDRPKDYYRLLGVPRDASATAIEQAYERLTRRSPAEPPSGLHELRAAYETLSDAERRRRYDQDLVSWSLLRGPATDGLRRPVERGTLSGDIVLREDEAAAGGVLPLDIPLSATCRACEGTGGDAFGCAECGGEGAVERRLPVTLRIPPGVRAGTLFHLQVDDPVVVSVYLTVSVRAL
jgi:DnaJ-class molecular chaperone